MSAPDAASGATLHVRLERQLNALLLISRRWRRYESDPSTAFKNITEAAAAALAVERASVWLMNDARDAIVCHDLYEYGRHRHTRGFKLTRADYPLYFAALERDEMIAATDAHHDPSTRAFSKGYLTPYGIGAMLDVPIRVGGELTGVLCHEHVGDQRLFLADEQTSARLLAHLASLACEIAGRRQSVERADWNYSLTQAAVDSAGVGVVATDLDGMVTYTNERVGEIWTMPEGLLGQRREERLAHVGKLMRDPDRYMHTIEKAIADPAGGIDALRVELKDGRALEVGSRPQIVDGNIIGRVWTVRELTGE
ncbi:MAG: GAF domain-containing protein [Gammaproteobacteria bacterium]